MLLGVASVETQLRRGLGATGELLASPSACARHCTTALETQPRASQSFPGFVETRRELICAGERWLAQAHDIIQRLFHRTLEVWGSIPHGSTRKNENAA